MAYIKKVTTGSLIVAQSCFPLSLEKEFQDCLRENVVLRMFVDGLCILSYLEDAKVIHGASEISKSGSPASHSFDQHTTSTSTMGLVSHSEAVVSLTSSAISTPTPTTTTAHMSQSSLIDLDKASQLALAGDVGYPVDASMNQTETAPIIEQTSTTPVGLESSFSELSGAIATTSSVGNTSAGTIASFYLPSSDTGYIGVSPDYSPSSIASERLSSLPAIELVDAPNTVKGEKADIRQARRRRNKMAAKMYHTGNVNSEVLGLQQEINQMKEDKKRLIERCQFLEGEINRLKQLVSSDREPKSVAHSSKVDTQSSSADECLVSNFPQVGH